MTAGEESQPSQVDLATVHHDEDDVDSNKPEPSREAGDILIKQKDDLQDILPLPTELLKIELVEVDTKNNPDHLLRQELQELTNQLSQLNLKLVKSFNRISNLEDDLHESEQLNARLKARNQTLERESAKHREALKDGRLMERANFQSELQRLSQRVVLESERRSKSEASLSSINQELDDLSASLFTEANRLVAHEKLQRMKAERKVVQAEEAMRQVEEIIAARRDQLNHLISTLEQAERERDEYRSQCEVLMSLLNQKQDLPQKPTSISSTCTQDLLPQVVTFEA